jgi:hypothetical protein
LPRKVIIKAHAFGKSFARTVTMPSTLQEAVKMYGEWHVFSHLTRSMLIEQQAIMRQQAAFHTTLPHRRRRAPVKLIKALLEKPRKGRRPRAAKPKGRKHAKRPT